MVLSHLNLMNLSLAVFFVDIVSAMLDVLVWLWGLCSLVRCSARWASLDVSGEKQVCESEEFRDCIQNLCAVGTCGEALCCRCVGLRRQSDGEGWPYCLR